MVHRARGATGRRPGNLTYSESYTCPAALSPQHVARVETELRGLSLKMKDIQIVRSSPF